MQYIFFPVRDVPMSGVAQKWRVFVYRKFWKLRLEARSIIYVRHDPATGATRGRRVRRRGDSNKRCRTSE